MSKIIPTSVLAKIISNRTFGIQKRLTSSDQINVDHAFDLARFQIQHATDYFTSHASTPVKKLKEKKKFSWRLSTKFGANYDEECSDKIWQEHCHCIKQRKN